MRFVPTEDYVYPWPVHVVFPSPTEAGKTVTETFTAKFKLLPSDVGEKLMEEQRQALLSADATAAAIVEGQKKQIRAFFVGWVEDTLLDDKKKPIAFSAEARDQLLNVSPIRDAVVRAYGESQRARPAEGN